MQNFNLQCDIVQLPILKCKVNNFIASILLDTGSTANFIAENTKVGSHLINNCSTKEIERDVCVGIKGISGESKFSTSLLEIYIGKPYKFRFRAYKVPYIKFSSTPRDVEDTGMNKNLGSKG